jgi:hypothetical protein
MRTIMALGRRCYCYEEARRCDGSPGQGHRCLKSSRRGVLTDLSFSYQRSLGGHQLLCGCRLLHGYRTIPFSGKHMSNLNENSEIINRTVNFWKEKGFEFAPGDTPEGSTVVTHKSGKPFRHFLTRYAPTVGKLLSQLDRTVAWSYGDGMLIVAGRYDGEAEFPFFLLTLEAFAEMEAAHHSYCAAMHDAKKYQLEFIENLFYLEKTT